MRLSILSNVNLDMLSGLLKKENEVFQTDGYGEWITYALKKDERLAAFAPECLFLLHGGNALLEGCQDIGSVKTVLDRSEQYIEKWRRILCPAILSYRPLMSGRNISVREMQVIWHRHPAPIGIRF